MDELKQTTRLERGAEIALYGKIIKVKNQDVWWVWSRTKPDVHYEVTEDGICTCPDHKYRGVTCEHFWAVVAKDGVNRVNNDRRLALKRYEDHSEVTS